MLEQLCRLNAERHREILWGVELVPIPLSGELSQFTTQILDWILLSRGWNITHVSNFVSLRIFIGYFHPNFHNIGLGWCMRRDTRCIMQESRDLDMTLTLIRLHQLICRRYQGHKNSKRDQDAGRRPLFVVSYAHTLLTKPTGVLFRLVQQHIRRGAELLRDHP
jgi:hypothetical protein